MTHADAASILTRLIDHAASRNKQTFVDDLTAAATSKILRQYGGRISPLQAKELVKGGARILLADETLVIDPANGNCRINHRGVQ